MITTTQIIGQNTEHLVECQDGHKLQTQVCKSFKEMQKAAESEGIDLQIVSSHRDFARQTLIWQRKWLGELPLYDIEGELLEGSVLPDSEKMHAILTWSALPGTSRHHWGTDLDVYDKCAVEDKGLKLQLVCKEYEAEGPCHKLACWLTDNASRYGFTRPYSEYKGGVAAEPWHLSYHSISNEIYQRLDVSQIKKIIEDTELAGKDTVLANIDMIFNRYILNKGKI
jgi:LAS superfamily LD-carboxypeptidase LdcB